MEEDQVTVGLLAGDRKTATANITQAGICTHKYPHTKTMKTIDEYRKSTVIFIVIDLVMLAAAIIVVTLFPAVVSNISIFRNPLTVLIVLGLLLLLDIVILRWLFHVSLEIDNAEADRSMRMVRSAYEAQKLLHIVVIAAVAGLLAGKLFGGREP